MVPVHPCEVVLGFPKYVTTLKYVLSYLLQHSNYLEMFATQANKQYSTLTHFIYYLLLLTSYFDTLTIQNFQKSNFMNTTMLKKTRNNKCIGGYLKNAAYQNLSFKKLFRNELDLVIKYGTFS